MQVKKKKIWILGVIIVYTISCFLQSNFSLFQTRAQENNVPRVNLVVVFVDNQIYDSISSRLSRYTTNYVQQQLTDTKALVMPLNLNNISAYDIHRMMENIYFDGLENVNSSLIGLIMVGKIPLPVVNQNGYIFPTVYPYVDFENQKYVRDSESNYFVQNGNPNGQAEIWHGLIDYGNDIQAYLDFFDKVKEYSQNPDGFIGDSMWYEDFIANKEGFINEYFQYYKNKIMFGEDLSYQRYSPLMKKLFGDSSMNASLDILTNLQDSVGTEFPGMDEDSLNSLKSQGEGMHTTKIIQQEIKDSYLADYNELFSKIGLSRMRENVFAGGRWIETYTNSEGQKNQIMDADSSSSMIQMKDTLYLGNDNLKGLIENLNELMEEMVDKKIENEKYSMDIVIPVQFERRTGKRVWGSCYTFVDRYENYYFGKDARYIDNPKDLSIYRGTYRNLNSLDGVTYNSLTNGYNPTKSQSDATNLRLKSIGASYDIFSTQVEGNRGYNNFLVSDDLDTYDANRARAQDEEETDCLKFLCRLRKRTWPTNCSDDDGECETVGSFVERRWGGASAINIDDDSISSGRYALKKFKATDSRRSMFDMGGFQALLSGNDEGMNGRGWISGKGTGPQKAATSFKAYIKYASPTQTNGWTTRGWGKMIYVNRMPDVHKSFSDLNYWNLNSTELNWEFSKTSNSDQMFTVADSRETKGCGWERDMYTYRFLSSVIKHTSTTDSEINGMDYYKYSDSGEVGINNINIMKAYDTVLDSLTGSIASYDALKNDFLGNNQLMLSWSGVSDLTGVNNALLEMNQIIDLTKTGVKLLHEGLGVFSLDEITAVYESIVNGWGGNINAYAGNYSSDLKKLGLLSGWIANINEASSAINANGLILRNIYNTSINSIIGQINLWNDYANDWKNIDGVSGDIIDDVSRRFSNNIFILEADEEDQEMGDMIYYDFRAEFNSGWLEFLSGYSINSNIFSNLITLDSAGSSIINIAKVDQNFIAWVDKNNINFDDDAELITLYAKWALNEGAETPLVKNNHDVLQGVVTHEDGMNILTPDRPIDSPRYVSMQSIAGNEINLIYPNLFKVEVFEQSGQNNNGLDIHLLLSKGQIKENLIKYLTGKVAEYNTILKTEYNNAVGNNTHYQKLMQFNIMATPDKTSRPYNYFTYDEFIEALGGEGMLDVIADMLYYQNLTNKRKLSSDNVSMDIDLIKNSFNVNDKREEVLKDYLTQGNEKIRNIALELPTYQISGYEVAYVNSNGRDYIIPLDSNTNQIEIVSTLDLSDASENLNISANNEKDNEKDNDECNIPLNGVLPLFEISSMSSPWYEGFKCRLKNLNVKVVLNFDNVDLHRFSGVLRDTFSDYGDQWNDLLSLNTNQEITNKQIEAEKHNQDVERGDGGVSNAFAIFSRNIKISNSNSLLSDNNPISELKIASVADIGNITVEFSSMGDGCLKIDNDSLCSGNQVSKIFNPKTDPLTLYVSSDDHIAGSSALDLKIILGGDYIEKIYKYTVSSSALDWAEIIVDEDKTVAGMLTPIEVVGYDKYDNRVSWGLDNYTFTVSTGYFLKDGVYLTGFTTNDFRNLKLYYRAPAEAMNNTEAIIQIVKSKDLSKYLATHRQRIVQASVQISVDGSVELTNNVLRSGKTIRLTSDENIYDDMGKIDISKLHTIVINVKDDRGNVVDVDSQFSITSQKGLIVLGQLSENMNNEDVFMKTSLGYISGGMATIYYYPTTVAGDDVITINIPGLETRVIDLSILPSSWVDTKILLQKNVLELGETANVEIFLMDKWGNVVDGTNTVSLSYDDEKIVLAATGLKSEISLNLATSVSVLNSNNLKGFSSNKGSIVKGLKNRSINFNMNDSILEGVNGLLSLSVDNGYSKIEVQGVGAGLSYIIGENSYAEVVVDKHIFPTSGLNIMYLNYFGDDWGNQWGYFSDHNKYIESLMKKSNKLITTTTQLVSEDKIKRIIWKVDPGLKIWNPDNVSTLLTLKNGKFNIKIGGISNMVSNHPSFNWMSVNNSTIESILSNSNTSVKNYAFFISNDDNYTVRNGILYSGSDSVLNIGNGEISLQLSPNKINGENVWSVVYDGVKYGSIIFHCPGFIPNLRDFNLLGSNYVINSTFTSGSTASVLSVGIFDTQSNFELNSSYKSIQDSVDVGLNAGFQGDFKNITLFAEGEIVGEATRKFGSEFVINLGDPVLSRKSYNENVYGTHYDGGIGQEIYVDSENDIVNTREIDFNNDGLNDLLVIYLDGSIRLAKNYGSTPDLRNMQELMRIAIPIKEVYVGDVDGNSYEDIIIRTQNNQIRVYLNERGIFDVDGNVVCLNANVFEGEVTQSPSSLDGLHQVFIEDMDLDNVLDFVTYDHKGYIKIFYGGTTNGYANYLSKEKYACDTGWYNRQVLSTQIITALGVNVTSDRIYDNSMLRRVGMEKLDVEVSDNDFSDFGITIDVNSLESKITAKDRNGDGSITAAMNEIMSNFDVNKASEEFINKSLKYQEVSLYENKLVGGSGNIYVFAPISYLTPISSNNKVVAGKKSLKGGGVNLSSLTGSVSAFSEDKAVAWKNYSVKSGGSILTDGDIVTVTVTIQAQQSFVGSFGDIIQGPWKLYFDDNNIFRGIEFVSNEKDAIIKKRDGNFAYLIDNISLNTGETMIFKYDLEYSYLPLKTIDVTHQTFWSDDDLPDIKLRSVDGCEKNFDAYINSGSRLFSKQTILLQDMIDDIYEDMENNTEDFSDIIAGVGSDVTQLPGMVGNTIQRKSVLGGSVKDLNIDQGGINLNLSMDFSFTKKIDEVTNEINGVIDDLMKGMCNGFSFGGSNNCAGLPVPFNQAFLAPGKYHLFGCINLPLGPLENGLPVFHFPGTGPLEIPFPWGLKGPGDSFIWVPGGVYPSLIRIYAAPTLTAQLGLAICLGPQVVSNNIPSPIADIAGNCVVFAIKPQCKKGSNGGANQDPQNPNETYSPIVQDVRNSGSCTLTQKGPMVTKRGYRSSPFNLYSYSEYSIQHSSDGEGFLSSRSNFNGEATMQTIFGGDGKWYQNMLNNADLNGGINNGTEYDTSFLGIVNLETSAAIGYFDEEGDQLANNAVANSNSIMIGDVDVLGGEFTVNKIRGGLQQGLRKMLIDKWLDPQIRYITNQLTKMHITVKWPDFKSFFNNESETWKNIINDFDRTMDGNIKSYSAGDYGILDQYNLTQFNSNISNPFETLASLMNQSNIFNISTETLTVKVPMVMPEDIASYGIYLQQWLDVNSEIVEDRREAIEVFKASCSKKSTNSEKEKCYEDSQKAFASFVEFEQNQWQKMMDQIYSNIQILQKYRNFPFEMYEWIHTLDRYVEEIASLVSNTFGYLSYRIMTNEERFVGYVDAIVLIINIIKTYQLIIDFSVEWGKNCGNCANDTYDQYSCKLSLLCDSIELPIIQIPNFKIPNITLDLSNIDLGLDIVLPKFNFQTINVELPDLPNLPEPPSVGIDINLFNLPDVPQLPEPPELPELPSFIPQIELELPILPPAPELPKLPNKIEKTIDAANIIGKIYCIVKGSFGLVGEKSVKAKIEQLTQRTYEVKWIDNIMDFTNRTAAPIKNYGVDYEISSYVDLQFNFTTFYNFMDMLTKNINNISTEVQIQNQRLSDHYQNISNKTQDIIDGRGIDGNYNLGYNGEMTDGIEYVDYDSARNRLHEVLTYFKKEANDTTFVDSLNSSIKKIENQINYTSKIEANLEGIESVEGEVLDYLKNQNFEYNHLAQLINDDYEGFLAMVDNQNMIDDSITSDSNNLLTFNVHLFNLDGLTKERIINLKNQNPYVDLLDNKKNIVDGYWNAIISNSADSLGLTQFQYLVLKDTVGNMKKQVATMYSVVRPTQSTSLITKDVGSSAKKTMVVSNSASLGGDNDTSITIDPQSFTQGIYEKITEGDNAGESLTKVVYSDSFAEDIGTNYYSTNNSQNHDIILRTSKAIYRKCANQICANGGNHFSSYYMHRIDTVPYMETWISFDGDTKLKIADVNGEVKNFKVKGQTYDNLSFSWSLDNVDAYLIKLVERVDYSYEKSDYTNDSLRVRYVLALPNGIDLENLYENNIKLELLKNKISEIKKLYGGDLVEVVYYDVYKPGTLTISNIERKWYYIRVAALELNGDTYNIASPWSNQIVAGRQIVGDDQSPLGYAELFRPSVGESVSEGDDLEGYVGTKYNLKVNREDNVALSYINISKDGKVLVEKYTSENSDSISVDIDIHTQGEKEIYTTMGLDQFGNKTVKNISVTYYVPDIMLTDISKNSDGETVTIVAELSQDIDQGNVSFQRKRGNVWKTMKRKNVDSADFVVKARDRLILGGPYSVGNDIAMYDKDDSLIALMDSNTAEIKIQTGYLDSHVVKVVVQNSSVLQLYDVNSNNLVFSISLPIKEFVKIEAETYSIVDLPEYGRMGMFNGGKAVYKDGENVLFISPSGYLYSELGLDGIYDYDRELGAIVLTLYQFSDLYKKNPIKVWLKVQPFVAG